ncbi:MAG TPA: M24 family metallopeptidase [Actinomycetota bacterium]|nr:M24 family metallopeptidase [Actinomycetota bacterium]
MTTFLLHDDAISSPEMRHEIGEAIMDPLTFVEHEGRRIVVGSSLEEAIFETREDVVDEFWNDDALGSEDLVRDQSFPKHLLDAELVFRALQKLGVSSVSVPPSFQLLVADYLREKGVTVQVDPDAWAQRRRHKAPWELEGIERAQRAADTAMLTAARMLREAEPTNGGLLRFEGEILTAELIRLSMEGELLSQGAESQDIIIQSGDACLRGHDLGTGPILPDTSCVIDCFPRDRRTSVYSDMTRTFVPGEPSDRLRKLHEDCCAALEIAFESIRPGTKDAFAKVAEFFDSQGHPTQLTHEGPGSLLSGFRHALGHGVGLAVHEQPWMGRRSDEFQVGDVVAVEPGLYFEGVGGVRIEDTVLVTADGVEHFTDPFPYKLEP